MVTLFSRPAWLPYSLGLHGYLILCLHGYLILRCCSCVAESRAIEQQGGYQFNISAVPNTFAFGAEGPPSNSFGGQS